MRLEKNMVDDSKLKAAFKFFDTEDKGFIGREDVKLLLKTGTHATKKIMDSTASNRKRDKITFDDFKKCILPEGVKAPKEEESLNTGRFGRGKVLGGPMDESSRRDDGGPGRTMDESSRRQPLSRQGKRGMGISARVSFIGKEGAAGLNSLAEVEE